MKAEARRKELIGILLSEAEPVSGAVLSERLGVSRQIIVQDISMVKAMGYEILSTHRGYLLQKSPLCERVFKVRHTGAQTEDELTCIVGLGGIVADVFVWHKVYGRITAPLNICSFHHIAQFLEGVRSGKSVELMSITGGYHYHTIRAETEEQLDRIGRVLDEKGYTVPEL
ncbi:MAG: transcription repressor NadR [Ruminococcaceae bacterium]|nr:transcription repressor NadR [Oscillospiraceae bacterium]